MDILHPSVVHFPIALLSLYSFLEIASLFPKIGGKLERTKAILVLTGAFFSIIARIAGLHDAKLFTEPSPTLILHKNASFYIPVIFGFLALSYVYSYLIGTKRLKKNTYLYVFTNKYLRVLTSTVGFGILLIVGAMGGALVHGPGADPWIRFVTSLFGL